MLILGMMWKPLKKLKFNNRGKFGMEYVARVIKK